MDSILFELNRLWVAVEEFFAFDPALLSQPDMISRIALQVVLLIASAFFSGSETALFSLSRLDLQRLRREGHGRSDTLHSLLEQPRRLIISILCGNELINVAAAANLTGILVILYGEARAGILSVLVMVPLLLLFGEVTPKTIAVSNPVGVSTRIIAVPMSLWVRVVAPLRWLVRFVADRITTGIVGEETTAENILRVDEFRTLVDEVVESGELTPSEKAFIYNLLAAGTTEVVEVMRPRPQTAFISADLTVPEIVGQVRAIRHARIPVYRDTRDHVVGFIHAEDLLRLVLEDADLTKVSLEEILRPPVMVPLTKKVDEMFDFFLHNKAQAAAVLNEFGGIEGFVTLRNVLDFVFGATGPERPRELVERPAEGVYEVAGDMKLTTFNDLTNFGLDDPRMTTVAGILLRHLDHLPAVGDEVSVEDLAMRVLELDGHRIARVRVAKGAAAEGGSDAGQVDSPGERE